MDGLVCLERAEERAKERDEFHCCFVQTVVKTEKERKAQKGSLFKAGVVQCVRRRGLKKWFQVAGAL